MEVSAGGDRGAALVEPRFHGRWTTTLVDRAKAASVRRNPPPPHRDGCEPPTRNPSTFYPSTAAGGVGGGNMMLMRWKKFGISASIGSFGYYYDGNMILNKEELTKIISG
jgi:hypothetical protein